MPPAKSDDDRMVGMADHAMASMAMDSIMSRWTERQNGLPVFGPESPIATREACDAVGGKFFASPLGWMVHANVFAGDDLASIFGDDHGAHAEHMDHQM
jgi:hypothetical protein